MSLQRPFDPSRLIPGTPGQLSEVQVAPAAAQPGDTVDPAFRAKATEAALKFESFFISHMLQQMRNGTRAIADEDSVFNNKVNQDMLDMADRLVADQMAGKRAFGVADAILRQILPAPVAAPVTPAAGGGQTSSTASVSESQNFKPGA